MEFTTEFPERLILKSNPEVIVAYRAVDNFLPAWHPVSLRLQRAIDDRSEWDSKVTHILNGEETRIVIDALHEMQCRKPMDKGQEWEQAAAANIILRFKPLQGTAIHDRAAQTVSHLALEGPNHSKTGVE